MTRRNIGTSTTPAPVAGAHLPMDINDAIAALWENGDATGRDGFVNGYTDAAMAAAAAGDATRAVDLLNVARVLSAETVNPYTEANIVFTYMNVAARMMDTMSDAARSIINRAGAVVDQSIVDRIGDPHRVPADMEQSSGQTYGTGKNRRAVGPWVRAAIATRPGAYMTHADIARWAMSTDPTTGDINGAPYGLTRTETGLTGRIGAWAGSPTRARDTDIVIGHRDGTAAIMYVGAP